MLQHHDYLCLTLAFNCTIFCLNMVYRKEINCERIRRVEEKKKGT